MFCFCSMLLIKYGGRGLGGGWGGEKVDEGRQRGSENSRETRKQREPSEPRREPGEPRSCTFVPSLLFPIFMLFTSGFCFSPLPAGWWGWGRSTPSSHFFTHNIAIQSAKLEPWHNLGAIISSSIKTSHGRRGRGEGSPPKIHFFSPLSTYEGWSFLYIFFFFDCA